ncbi:membrane protein [Nocardioides sp. J9]|uniref:YhjD/YihY/BrkB family envelope integrity protein n=1 Tax=Nocardioides sp. J9 TaxID=935844 RepID=UPI0011ADDBA1|nr:YhjD/YihY/BrkB family envelope integrity protein [Nocardioides sp. J9]TWH04900.1 membrane protein [Nocardioides sp. J9]
MLPGLIGSVGLVGVLGLLYAGLGWVSSMRFALSVMFGLPRAERPSYLRGKGRDLGALCVLGLVLLLSVAVSGVVTRLSGEVLELVGLASSLGWLLSVAALALGVAIGTLLFFLMFRLLAEPPAPSHALWSGALLGAVGFELLKQASGLLLTLTQGRPAFQAFGIALILLVWINYFSRVVLLAAAWAHTDASHNHPVEGDTP